VGQHTTVWLLLGAVTVELVVMAMLSRYPADRKLRGGPQGPRGKSCVESVGKPADAQEDRHAGAADMQIDSEWQGKLAVCMRTGRARTRRVCPPTRSHTRLPV